MSKWEWTPERRQAAELHYPEVRKPPPAGVFEIALSCAGATSTAAYTAGVLDFLFQALDEWERTKVEKPDDAPGHQVCLRAMIGTSGGGMSLAIAAANAGREFPPVSHEDVAAYLETPKKGRKRRARAAALERLRANPLFATWVMGVDLVEGVDPLSGAPLPGLATEWLRPRPAEALPSLLNCEIIDTLAASAIAAGKPGVQGRAARRGWLADPLELRLTVTNLNGVPFDVSFGGAHLAQTFLAARDEAAFAVETGGTRPADLAAYPSAAAACPPDCRFLPRDADDRGAGAWKDLAAGAVATGALPVALEMRALTTPREAYLWRSLRHVEGADPLFNAPRWWDEGADNSFIASDGGFVHDPPFEYARTRLAGFRGRNPRNGGEANRALILIDPLLGTERGRDTSSLLAALGSMLMAPVEQSRMDASAVLAAADEKVYSRFMITPRRSHPLLDSDLPKLNGSYALVAAGVHAFLGFVSETYRAHDFMLGRRNAQKFLSDAFAVPDGNPILADGRWSERHKQMYRAGGDGPAHYQIIPLCGSARDVTPTPDWPAGAVETNSKAWRRAEKMVRTRLNKIAKDFALEVAGGDHPMVSNSLAPMVMNAVLATTMINALKAGVDRVNDNMPAVSGAPAAVFAKRR